MARKVALVIGNNEYQDILFTRLVTPAEDAQALADVLRSPTIGGFDEVFTIINKPGPIVRRAIAVLFANKKPDDLLLLYFSGHGVRDDNGLLYLAVQDTEHGLLDATAIPAAFITEGMNRSRSQRQVLILDCCHSGAFAHGTKGAPGLSVGTSAAFEGTGFGRVVLTATDATQYAWEGDQVTGHAVNSVFTRFLVEGLRTGAADNDGDGRITLDEWYDYVYEQVLRVTPKQTPGKWSYRQQGEFVIANNPSVNRKPAKLAVELEDAIRDRRPWVREGAVRELGRLIKDSHPNVVDAAREALQQLVEQDDSGLVKSAAAEALTFDTKPQAVQEAADNNEERKKHESAEQTQRVAELEAERVALETAQAKRSEQEKAEQARLEQEKADQKRLEAEKAKAPRQPNGEPEHVAPQLGEAAYRSGENARAEQQTPEYTKAKIQAESKPEAGVRRKTSKKLPLILLAGIFGSVLLCAVLVNQGAHWLVAELSPAIGNIAFVSNRDGRYQIYVINADGSGLRQLTDRGGQDGFPTWSRDGHQIAFTSLRDSPPDSLQANFYIYTMNADGSAQTQITNVVTDAIGLAWSPESPQIAFTSKQEIYVINVDGSALKQLTNNSALDFGPAWSPDGNRIAFYSNRDGRQYQIYVMNNDGSAQKQLTNGTGDAWEPAWSPDGRHIAFYSYRDRNAQIYMMNADGSAQERLTHSSGDDRDPKWSPDGSHITFDSNRDGNEEIYVMRADGSDQRRLTIDSSEDSVPAWQP